MTQRSEEHNVIAVISHGIEMRHFSSSIEYNLIYDKIYADGRIERWRGKEYIGQIPNEYRGDEK